MNNHQMKGTEAELIALGEEFELAWASERDVVAVAAETREGDALCGAAVKRTSAIVKKIEQLQAVTIDGLKVKIAAMSWARGGSTLEADEESTTDERLIASIANDVAAM